MRSYQQTPEVKRVREILLPHIDAIVGLSEAGDSIVFVVHRPSQQAANAMRRLGAKLRKGTTAFSRTCADLVPIFARDEVTRNFISQPSAPDRLRIFLVVGGGTELLTIFGDGSGNIYVEAESNTPPAGDLS